MPEYKVSIKFNCKAVTTAVFLFLFLINIEYIAIDSVAVMRTRDTLNSVLYLYIVIGGGGSRGKGNQAHTSAHATKHVIYH